MPSEIQNKARKRKRRALERKITQEKLNRLRNAYNSFDKGNSRIWDVKTSYKTDGTWFEAEFDIFTDLPMKEDPQADLRFPPLEIQALCRTWTSRNQLYSNNVDILHYSTQERMIHIRVLGILPEAEDKVYEQMMKIPLSKTE
jgi:hypothetical protein